MSSMHNTEQSKLITEIHEAWAVAHGYRDKPQAASIKPEELHAVNTTSFKHQAASGYDGDIGPTSLSESYLAEQKMIKRQAARKLQASSSKRIK